MSTRSRIGIVDKKGYCTTMYCHFDGYPEHQLPILQAHYKTNEKVINLLDCGGISVLTEAGPEGAHHEGTVTDRTRDAAIRTARACDAEWLYLFDGNDWEVIKIDL